MKKQVAISSTLTLLLLLCLLLSGCGSKSSGLPPKEPAKTPAKVSGGLTPGTPGTGIVRFTVTVPEGPSVYPKLKPITKEIPAGTRKITVCIYSESVLYKEVKGYSDVEDFYVEPGVNTINCSMVVPVGKDYNILVLASDYNTALTIGQATEVAVTSEEKNSIGITLNRLKIENLAVEADGTDLTATFDLKCPINLDEYCYLEGVNVLLVNKNDDSDRWYIYSDQLVNDLQANTPRNLNLTMETPPQPGEEEKIYVCSLIEFGIYFKIDEHGWSYEDVAYAKEDNSPIFEILLKGDGTWSDLEIEVN